MRSTSAYNGHYESVCYHPLFLFNDHGDCLAAKLRSGNVSSADDWDELLLPEIDRQRVVRVTMAARGSFTTRTASPACHEYRSLYLAISWQVLLMRRPLWADM